MKPPLGSRQAIVLSGWDWRTNNIPERMALVLARAGWRILYCENPTSFLRRRGPRRFRVSERVEGFGPLLVGHRLNTLPFAARCQAELLVGQILRRAREMGLSQPVVIYPHGHWVVEVARKLKRRGIPGIFICMDQIERKELEALAESSTMTLAIPRATFAQLQEKFGDKIRLIPQFGPDLQPAGVTPAESQALARVERIPRPRLAYFGPPTFRLHAGLVKALFAAHPEWHFVTCGPAPNLQLPNLHDIGWVGSKELPAISRAIDAGFMPYDCRNEMNLHCVPLKLFDYFAAGLPVVSTPLVHLRQYGDLVYLGDSTEALAEGIRKALAEPPGDPRRDKRLCVARAHSIDEMAKILPAMLVSGAEKSAGRTREDEKTSTVADDKSAVEPGSTR